MGRRRLRHVWERALRVGNSRNSPVRPVGEEKARDERVAAGSERVVADLGVKRFVSR